MALARGAADADNGPRMPSPTSVPDRDPTAWFRRVLVLLLGFGMVGLLAELLLLKHFEEFWQYSPLGLIGLALASLVWYSLGGGAASLRLLRATMVLFIIAGLAGVVLHYRGSLEFQLEMDPTQHGWALFKKVIQAKTPPALAPGIMVQLGLLGLVFAYRHPAFDRTSASTSRTKGVLGR
jgi:hypothetical protein